VKGQTGMNVISNLRDLTRDHWYRSELVRALRNGPGALSLYFSLLIGLLSSVLAFVFIRELETASLAVFLVMVFLSLNFILLDLGSCLRNHGLLLLRKAVRRSEQRMKRLRVESNPIFALLDWLYIEPDLEKPFRNESNGSIQTVVKALDRLSETAIRYGARGKRVFEKNLEPFLMAEMLMRSVKEPNSDLLGPELKNWLKEVPYYDPEGWSLALSEDPSSCCIANDSAK
jgi:hypothetical protein